MKKFRGKKLGIDPPSQSDSLRERETYEMEERLGSNRRKKQQREREREREAADLKKSQSREDGREGGVWDPKEINASIVVATRFDYGLLGIINQFSDY
jgi:hypothetical protein